MAITVDTLKVFRSERMTDFDDGGGKMSATALVSGSSNQVFDDVSDVDRASGDLSIRKVYAAVTSADTDKYLDAGVVILSPPADPNVSVLAFSTGDYFDERAALVNLLESSVSRATRYNGWLYGAHIAGQRSLQIWARTTTEPVAVGDRLYLVAQSGGSETHGEYLWVTSASVESRVITDNNGTFYVTVLICEIAYPLENAYTGSEPVRTDPSSTAAAALLYETRYNPDIVDLYGVKPLTVAGTTGDYSITVDGIYQQMIPTGLQETALADIVPGGDSLTLLGGTSDPAGRVSVVTTLAVMAPNATWYLGSGVHPGTLSITVSGATITDVGGVMRLGETDVGTIDYSNGVTRWNSSCPNYGTSSKTASFRPATAITRVANSGAQFVTVNNRGFVWVITLAPIPAPKSLRISYRAVGQWYTLTDRGDGVLTGANSSYGVASLNFSTGTVTLTTGALPDVDSEILYAWTVAVDATPRGGIAVDAPVVRGQTANAGVARNTFSIAWPGGSVTDNGSGLLTGTGGSGEIRYATGEWWLRPTTVPASGTEFTVDYDHGSLIEETFLNPAVASDVISLSLANTNIAANTVDLEWTGRVVTNYNPDLSPYWTTVTDHDDGAGGFLATSGTINYAAGTLSFTATSTLPDRNRSQAIAAIGEWAE